MVKLYEIEARCLAGHYVEKVTVLMLEEKPKTYTGPGTRIDKTKIGNVQKGLLIGSFLTYVLQEEDILSARQTLKKSVEQHVRKEFEVAQRNMDAFERHSLDAPYRFINDYED